jgi:hypothetical protein
MDPFTLFLILIWIPLLALALPIFEDLYRFLTRSKRKAATRARLARLPPPSEALEGADGHEIVAYLSELLGDGEVGDALRDEEVKARFEEIVRIVERREARKAAAASSPSPRPA